jgi:branched-chain amino acid transport system substrate-binding protein
MDKRIKICVILGVVAGLALLPAAGFGAGPIKIGGVFALSGPAAHIGRAQRDACLISFDKVNKAGGIKGRSVEFIIEDTEGDPTKAVMKVKKLIEVQKVVALIGPTRTGTGMAVRPVIEKAQVPTFMHVGGDPILFPMKKGDPTSLPKWVFKSPYKTADALGRIFKYMKKKKMTKIGFLHSSDGFGRFGLKEAKASAPEYGIDMITIEAFDVRDTDMTTQLTKMRAKNPQAIIAWTIGPPMGIIPKNVKQLGIETPLFECHGAADPIFLKLAGDAADGVMMPSTKIVVADQLSIFDRQRKRIQGFVKDYETRFKKTPGTMVAYGVDAADIVLDALKKAGPDRAKIRDELEKIKFVGISGIYKMSPTDHNGLDIKDIVMVRAEKGSFRHPSLFLVNLSSSLLPFLYRLCIPPPLGVSDA